MISIIVNLFVPTKIFYLQTLLTLYSLRKISKRRKIYFIGWVNCEREKLEVLMRMLFPGCYILMTKMNWGKSFLINYIRVTQKLEKRVIIMDSDILVNKKIEHFMNVGDYVIFNQGGKSRHSNIVEYLYPLEKYVEINEKNYKYFGSGLIIMDRELLERYPFVGVYGNDDTYFYINMIINNKKGYYIRDVKVWHNDIPIKNELMNKFKMKYKMKEVRRMDKYYIEQIKESHQIMILN